MLVGYAAWKERQYRSFDWFCSGLFIDIYGAFFVLLKGHVSECIISYNSAVDVTFHQSVCCLLFWTLIKCQHLQDFWHHNIISYEQFYGRSFMIQPHGSVHFKWHSGIPIQNVKHRWFKSEWDWISLSLLGAIVQLALTIHISSQTCLSQGSNTQCQCRGITRMCICVCSTCEGFCLISSILWWTVSDNQQFSCC